MAAELTKRVAVAAVGIPFAVLILYIGGWPLAIVLALLAGMGANEFVRIARHGDVYPPAGVAIAGSALFLLVAAGFDSLGAAAPALGLLATTLVLVTASAVIWTRGVEGRPLASAGAALFAVLLTGGMLAYAVFLRQGFGDVLYSWKGFAVVAFPLAVTWINDTFAYFGGRSMGRHKLIPRVSPGKTVEGTAAGLVGAVITSVLYCKLVFAERLGIPIGMPAAVLGGVLLSAAAVIGDLAESLLKREAGVKDSGTLLPGHGGVLDRFDALYFTLPVAYWFLYYATRAGLR
ncbi:MAG TPA: phosphatidate cytidylyltransferase [Longimicrobiales bacterium]